MTSLDGIVELSGACLYTALRSVIESGAKEVLGDLIGKKYLTNYILVNSYPYLTAARTPLSSYYQNKAAIERLRIMNKTLNKWGGIDFSVVGQYHSHICQEKERKVEGLSKEDIDFFREELEKSGRKESVQIVLNVKAKKYRERKPKRETLIDYPKKLRIILQYDFDGYDISISAFKLSRKNIKEMRVKRRRIRIVKV